MSTITESTRETVADRLTVARQVAAEMRVVQPKGVRRPPGPSRPQVIKALATGKIAGIDFMTDLHSYRPIGYARVGPEHLYALTDPADIWHVFGRLDADVTRGRAFQATRAMLGGGVLTAEGEAHKRQRSLMQPAFSPRHINSYAADFVAAAQQQSEAWGQRHSTSDNRVRLADDASALTLEIVGQTLLGRSLTGEASEVGAALTEVLDMFGFVVSPVGLLLAAVPNPRRKRVLAAIERLDAIVFRVIAEKRAELAQAAASDDILSVLIEARDQNGVGLTDDLLRDEVMTLVLAGHETTANNLTWTWWYLSQNQQAREWVEEEWDQTGELSAASFPSLPRTRAVIAESLRLRPPVWLQARRLDVDTELQGYQIPRGSTVFAAPFVLGQDERFFANPKSFQPERWLSADGNYDEKALNLPQGAWFPFGFASRRCLGERFSLLESALVLATIGKQWRIHCVNPQRVHPVPTITLRPSNCVPSLISPR